MIKSLKNFTDAEEILQKYGADALRLYLIKPPVVFASVPEREAALDSSVVLDSWIIAGLNNLIKFEHKVMNRQPIPVGTKPCVKTVRNVRSEIDWPKDSKLFPVKVCNKPVQQVVFRLPC
ncbi:uncharacterized protein PITG_01986 [Phytophthora infestans T30-4]|uniref:Aminoacyl-tRNA synthetase class Ia domain-containing protein n=1 Tax=Phytophthora infestans (strain T30-4) TaxID=403677 RepID=D0MUK7_PHYIT|nr:uncharacterized protein PITG_01986 [Phytophthora infestans T30-4]EEY61654.1 hypothetical protein PITG_01986 [Phytophthora infestans T30-4]|eukprot:XP_002908571.1 hypothetical protein PITG_01986 [Phytophthora infestans T30-4]